MNVAHGLTGLMPFGVGVGMLAISIASVAYYVSDVTHTPGSEVGYVVLLTWMVGGLITAGIFILAVTSLLTGATMIKDGLQHEV